MPQCATIQGTLGAVYTDILSPKSNAPRGEYLCTFGTVTDISPKHVCQHHRHVYCKYKCDYMQPLHLPMPPMMVIRYAQSI